MENDLDKQNVDNSGEQNVGNAVQIAEALNKARAEERSKLMGKMEELKTSIANKDNTIKELNSKISTLEKENKELTDAKSDFEKQLEKKLEEGKKLGNQEVEKLTQERDEAIQRAEKAEKEFADFKASLEIKEYRAEKVKDLDDDFKDLVEGSTKEEIDESYNKIKEKFDKISERFKKEDKPGLPTPHKDIKVTKKVSLRDVEKMSLSEYAEWRKSLEK